MQAMLLLVPWRWDGQGRARPGLEAALSYRRLWPKEKV